MSESTPKLFSLRVHQSTQLENDIMVSQQSGSELRTGDIVEIYKDANDKSSSHVLLKITVSDEMIKGTDSVSIVDTICNNRHFNFKTFNQVYLKKVTPEPVDLVVLTCKDTYLSRSDMWRLKKHLEKKCVYIDKRVTFIDIVMQITVSEIWLKGDALACGYISDSTRICFRSSSSVLHIFLQMSVEMWEYDSYGDLYFEKAVSGFLTDLFDKWKNAECDHEITIVMFSRTFYQANSLEEFPDFMKESIQTNGDGFYEDFYRVVIKNERYDDWRKVLMKMKQLFINYEQKVLRIEERKEYPSIPRAYNSSAAQGNYLEVLNMSLNLFEKYFLDRNFDRLGKVAVVITPGPGVFEVDRDLMNVTKHRTIDTGSAADLICMGEQPLHTVPLFKVRDSSGRTEVSKIPNSWINHSFYTSQSQMRVTSTAQFVPRIKLASKKTKHELRLQSANCLKNFGKISETDENNEEIDYDAYDSNIFKSSARRGRNPPPWRKHNRYSSSSRILTDDTAESSVNGDMRRQMSAAASAASDNMPDRVVFSNDSSKADEDDHSYSGSIERLDSTMTLSTTSQHHKAVDPFNPNSVSKPVSANRRRWVHAFPIDKNGVEIQPHHIYVDDPRLPVSSHKLLSFGNSPLRLAKRVSSENKIKKSQSVLSYDEAIRNEYSNSFEDGMTVSPQGSKFGSAVVESFAKTELIENIQAFESENTEFSPMTKTGVDWRSLTTPALLPISTDYYPSDQTLSKDYQDIVYSLDPLFESPMNYAQFFKELASIRLALGFQLIQPKESHKQSSESNIGPLAGRSTLKRLQNKKSNKESYRLSVGNIFHQLDLLDDSITVRIHRPKKVRKVREIAQYRYQFMCPDSSGYYSSVTKFATEQLETYKWNILDNYVINRGFKNDGNEDLLETHEGMKYWCSRFCLLPTNNNAKVKAIRDAKTQTGSTPACDIFTHVAEKEYAKYNENFIRFLELVNCFSRKVHQRSGNKMTKTHMQDEGVKTSSSTEEQVFDLSRVDGSLVDKMKDPSKGFPFLDSKSLPSGTFISYEALTWVRNNCRYVRNNTEALHVLQKLLSDGHIEHVSKSYNQYLCGFYLYYIVSVHSSSPVGLPESRNTFDFEKEWVEVSFAVLAEDYEMSAPSSPSHEFQRQNSKTSLKLQRQGSSSFKTNSILPPSINENGYKSSDIDTHLSLSSKADQRRVEWISLKYYSYYHPHCGYDLELDWIVATGCLLSEMVNSWRRKMNNYGFNLLPIPVDPFALPTEKNSDPLRGPIFVPLDTRVTETASNKELIDFMKYLIGKFGFMPITHDFAGSRPITSTKFIHATGGFFLIIQGRESAASINTSEVGFHWSWNFMITKHWWSAGVDCELFEDTMLEDFRLVTSDQGGRLRKHWQEWSSRLEPS